MPNFTKHDLALIGVRLLSIYLILQIIGDIPNMLVSLSIIFNQSSNFTFPIIYKLFAVVILLLTVLVPILLWKFSANISNFIVKSENLAANLSTESRNLQTVLFCTVGLFIFLTNLSDAILGIFFYLRTVVESTPYHQQQQFSYISVIISSMNVLFGLLLMVGADNVSKLLYKIRYGGPEK